METRHPTRLMQQWQHGEPPRHLLVIQGKIVNACGHIAGVDLVIAELTISEAGKMGHQIPDQRRAICFHASPVGLKNATPAETRDECFHRIVQAESAPLGQTSGEQYQFRDTAKACITEK